MKIHREKANAVGKKTKGYYKPFSESWTAYTMVIEEMLKLKKKTLELKRDELFFIKV